MIASPFYGIIHITLCLLFKKVPLFDIVLSYSNYELLTYQSVPISESECFTLNQITWIADRSHNLLIITKNKMKNEKKFNLIPFHDLTLEKKFNGKKEIHPQSTISNRRHLIGRVLPPNHMIRWTITHLLDIKQESPSIEKLIIKISRKCDWIVEDQQTLLKSWSLR